MKPSALLALLLLAAPAARAQDAQNASEAAAEEEQEPPRTLELGLKGSKGREANTSDFNWGPTASLGILTSPENHLTRVKYEFELNYDDATSDFQSTLASQSTRVRTLEFRYAKVHLLELFGFDFKKRILLVPYVSGGVQHVDSREDTRNFDEETGLFFSESKRQRYWAATFGFGAAISLNKKVSLALDYDQNAERGDRKVTRLSFELKYAVWGDAD